MSAPAIIVLVYGLGFIPGAVLMRRWGCDGPSALMLGLSWPMVPVAFAVALLGKLLEKVVKVKK